jgi:flagellar protein FliS
VEQEHILILTPNGLEFMRRLPITKVSSKQEEFKMFTPANMRSANAYRAVGQETAVTGADAHQLINLLFDAMLQALGKAKLAMRSGDIAGKGRAIGHAVRIIEEGLKASLNEAQGGQLAQNLHSLYDYCTLQLTVANLKNDPSKLEEVERLLAPVAQSWKQIRGQTGEGV